MAIIGGVLAAIFGGHLTANFIEGIFGRKIALYCYIPAMFIFFKLSYAALS
jgi:hypothetical protein